MHNCNLKCSKNKGHVPGLACVKYNQKLAFHHGDTISKGTISPATLDDSVIHRRPYYDMHAMQCKDVINRLQ